jgi:hypothetical protein
MYSPPSGMSDVLCLCVICPNPAVGVVVAMEMREVAMADGVVKYQGPGVHIYEDDDVDDDY